MYRRAVCRVVKARRRQLWENIPIEERPGSEELVRVICGSCRQTTDTDILHLGGRTESDILSLGEITESDILCIRVPPPWKIFAKLRFFLKLSSQIYTFETDIPCVAGRYN